MTDLVSRAFTFAETAHEGQKRRYTGESYFLHALAVALILDSVPHTDEMMAAAFLHDVVEDCAVSLDTIRAQFGDEVADLVYWLTAVSKPADGDRATRKEIDRQHIAKAPAAAKTIKLADVIDNLSTLRERDPAFYEVYRKEKQRLLEVLKEGDQTLWERAAALI